MNNFIEFTFSLIIIICLTNVDAINYKIEHIEVPLDHFGYATNKTFQLRYLVNDSYVPKTGGPILFYTGNEGDIELFAQNTGFIFDAASRLKALIIFAEHRYYGKSLPFGNKSFDSPAYLGYLTSEQALGDYAQLLEQINPIEKRQPVIAIGGSYGGMLAAWFRFKYPHIITGALAASAPVLQFPGITQCNIFNRILTSVFQTAYNVSCSQNIAKSWNVLKTFASNDNTRAQLNEQFKFCTNLTKPDDIEMFFDYLEDVYGNLAMANYPYDNDFLAPLPAYPVRAFCKELSNDYKDLDLIKALQRAVNIYANYTGNNKCLDYKSAYDYSMGTLGWEFQSCTEMVMPMCSDGKHDMFREKKWDYQKYSDDCFKKFNVRPRGQHIIDTYSAQDIDFASNIIFSNGLLDPWSGGGVLRTSNPKVEVLILPEGAHHLDLRAANPNDPYSVRQARNIEIKLMKSWIMNFHNYV